MTIQQTQELLSLLKIAYPNFYNRQTDGDIQAAIKVWAAALKSYSYEYIKNGISLLVQTNKYPPTIADVVEAARMSNPDPMEKMAQIDAVYRQMHPDWVRGGRCHYQRLEKVKQRQITAEISAKQIENTVSEKRGFI